MVPRRWEEAPFEDPAVQAQLKMVFYNLGHLLRGCYRPPLREAVVLFYVAILKIWRVWGGVN